MSVMIQQQKQPRKNTFWFSWSAMLAVTAAVISNCHGNGAGRWGGLRARRRHFFSGFFS
jgi:hypothetical protein